jgi:hypothetical protein
MTHPNNDNILTPEQKRIRELEGELKKRDVHIEYLEKVNGAMHEKIARAKDINPVKKSSLSRTKRLCESAGLDVEKVQGGYQLSFGPTLKRVFKKLSYIFDILILGDWYLLDIFKSDFFAPNKYGYVPNNSSFKESLERTDDSVFVSPETSVSLGLITRLAVTGVHKLTDQAKQFVETVDKYANTVSHKLLSTPFADSYTDQTLNQAQNSYDTWDESLDGFLSI